MFSILLVFVLDVGGKCSIDVCVSIDVNVVFEYSWSMFNISFSYY